MSNPLKLQFPQDRFGNLSRFKAEGLKAVERMYGNDDKLDTFLATLRVIAQHAKARHAQQKANREATHGAADAVEPEPEVEVPEQEPELVPEPTPEPVIVPEPEQVAVPEVQEVVPEQVQE